MSTPSPCQACPWRVSNQGRRHPDGWYTKRNLARLWSKLRRGEQMSCHPTDRHMAISEKAQSAGYREAPDHAQTKECVGSMILTQREAQTVQDDYGTFPLYRRARPFGLTKGGAFAVIMRASFPNIMTGKRPPLPDLNEEGIGYEKLGTWRKRKGDE